MSLQDTLGKFTNYRELLREQIEKRESLIRLNYALFKTSIKISGQTERIFTGKREIHTDLCLKIRVLLAEAREVYKLIFGQLNTNSYHRFNNMWRSANQYLINGVFIVIYLEKGTMASVEDIVKLLGEEQTRNLSMLLEQYVYGLVNFCHTIVRLAHCWGACGDVITAFDTLKFYMKCITCAKRMKITSDSSRKTFDTIKNEIKTVERTMYDIRIRNVLPKTEEEGREMVKERQELIEKRRTAFMQLNTSIKPEVVAMEIEVDPVKENVEEVGIIDEKEVVEGEDLKISYFWHFNKNIVE